MNNRSVLLLLFLFVVVSQGYTQTARREILFDDAWKFFLGDAKGAEKPRFDDHAWRAIDLPHDWSIEKLEEQETGKVIGPFSKDAPGTESTGHTVGGTVWYRKTFRLAPGADFEKTIISFDGVYMTSEVWVNGKLAGNHTYGYTPFYFDITDYLKPEGKPNVIAVRVRNDGRNSRWYSGSGIYRHVWLIRKQTVHLAHHGIFITTVGITGKEAEMHISSVVEKITDETPEVTLKLTIAGPGGKVIGSGVTRPVRLSSASEKIEHTFLIPGPKLWSLEEPNLYTAEIQVVADGKVTDIAYETFGIRTIRFDPETGFTLNGKTVLLKGGCMHHDNGFLGSATIDRAEERRVELMKAYGFNAIRTSHNPPSRQFLDACDRKGVLVIDEAFDMWERPKNPEDYHLYFKEWWRKDLESMVYRDRNHPSVILWSIGNEINERADSAGFVIRNNLVDAVRRLDPTRPVTEAICQFWDHPGQDWSTTAQAFGALDVGGYNYQWRLYEPDHELFPRRIMMGTESVPKEAYDNWKQVEQHPWVIGDFVWTGMDYLGESGIGNTHLDNDPDSSFLRSWPWFNAFCGDIDLCGFKKPQLLYRDVLWNNSKLEIAVHSPVPDGAKEIVSYWGWPRELQSWNWNGSEGKLMDVRVFSACQLIRLELNGKIIAEQPAGDSTRYIATFKVPYEPGILKATALENGIEVASKELRTTGEPAGIKLTADRTHIKADRNDLSYVKVEIVDARGNLIPDAVLPVTFTVSGAGEMAGSGNACPGDMESFNNPVCKTYRGRALVIIRPLKGKKTGTAILRAEADELVPGKIDITVSDNR